MMRLVLITLGLLLAQPVWAGWVVMGVGGEGATDVVIFGDPATVRKTANGRRVWMMWSYDKPQPNSVGGTYQSTKNLEEFDCAGERFRTLQSILHSDKFGRGPMVAFDNDLGPWIVVPPGSLAVDLLQAACKLPLPK